MAVARRVEKEVDYLPQVTVLTSAEWSRIKGKSKRVEETNKQHLLEQEKADLTRQRNALEAECIANAKNRLFCESESIRKFHSALMLTEVLKEREAQIEMKRNIKRIEDDYLEKEELKKNRDVAAQKEFQKYTEGVLTKAAEAKLNLIPLVRSAMAGINTHGAIVGELPVFYQPVFDKRGERETVKQGDSAAVEVGISGLGFAEPEKPLEYEYPDLSSKRIGRFSRLLVDTDRQDKRMNFPKREAELTKFVAKAWAKGQGKPGKK